MTERCISLVAARRYRHSGRSVCASSYCSGCFIGSPPAAISGVHIPMKSL